MTDRRPSANSSPRGSLRRGGKTRSLPRKYDRVVIENVRPQVDEGTVPAKAIAGEPIVVEADIYSDNHEALACDVLYRRRGDRKWTRQSMVALSDERWRAELTMEAPGWIDFTIEAWVDRFARWQRELKLHVKAGEHSRLDLRVGAGLIEDALGRAEGPIATSLQDAVRMLRSAEVPIALRCATNRKLRLWMRDLPEGRSVVRYRRTLKVQVDRVRAAYGAWYEMLPRSASTNDKPGTFQDVTSRLDYVANMGFDVLYLPPIHPIGETHRKGRNNSLVANPGDPGSPWAIGSAKGGHKSIDPSLGTLTDFRRLLEAAGSHGIEIALDIALQCSPDHPYLEEHPEWFRKRPDGSIQYAQNPPKKYQDIYPFDWETEAWRSLWEETLSIFLYWMKQGVRIFRVDNPHTKPFDMWQWCISEIHRIDPGVILLAEAFTQPIVMHRLSAVGFTQSYTHFPWMVTRQDLVEHFTALSSPPLVDYVRRNAWPNTPDILTRTLQKGGRPGFVQRLVLAATLNASYGIYGPAFELMEHKPFNKGSEEYRNSEKYEVKRWNLQRRDSLSDVITRVNAIRRSNPALQSNRGVCFYDIDNRHLLAYSRLSPDRSNLIVCVVNLDPRRAHRGKLRLPLKEWGIDRNAEFEVHDLLNESTHRWRGPDHRVRLDPAESPALILRLPRPRKRKVPTA